MSLAVPVYGVVLDGWVIISCLTASHTYMEVHLSSIHQIGQRKGSWPLSDYTTKKKAHSVAVCKLSIV